MEFSSSHHSTVPKVHQSVSQSVSQALSERSIDFRPMTHLTASRVTPLTSWKQNAGSCFSFQRLSWKTASSDRRLSTDCVFISAQGKTWWRLPPRRKPPQLQPNKEGFLFIRNKKFLFSSLSKRQSVKIILHSGQTVKLQCLTVYWIPKRLFPLRLWGRKRL